MNCNQNKTAASRAADTPQTLPSFPDVDGSGQPVSPDIADTPQTLPSYPDIDGSGLPITPQPIPPTSSQPSQPIRRCCPGALFPCGGAGGAGQRQYRLPEGGDQPGVRKLLYILLFCRGLPHRQHPQRKLRPHPAAAEDGAAERQRDHHLCHRQQRDYRRAGAGAGERQCLLGAAGRPFLSAHGKFCAGRQRPGSAAGGRPGACSRMCGTRKTR